MSNRPLVGLLAGVALLALAGCANPFGVEYQPAPNLTELAPTLAPYSGTTRVIESDHLRIDLARWRENGYRVVGTAAFKSEHANYRSALEAQGRAVGADIALLKSKLDHDALDVAVLYEPPMDIHNAMNYAAGDHTRTDYAVVHIDRYHAIFLRKTLPVAPSDSPRIP